MHGAETEVKRLPAVEAPWGVPDRQTLFFFLVKGVEHQNELNRSEW